jgi:hypothetical protein
LLLIFGDLVKENEHESEAVEIENDKDEVGNDSGMFFGLFPDFGGCGHEDVQDEHDLHNEPHEAVDKIEKLKELTRSYL